MIENILFVFLALGDILLVYFGVMLLYNTLVKKDKGKKWIRRFSVVYIFVAFLYVILGGR